MAETKLGTFKSLDLRKTWPNEANHFTPWLAEEENIATLGEALGLELAVESIEVAVGPYSADILARDTATDRFVVIENQLGKTNHDHLGKYITYGSVLDASAVVWIAGDFTEQHQKALSWLNEYTSDDLAFYGVRLEVWQIDESLPAVRFNVLSRPAHIKRQQATGTEELSEAKALQLEFWTAFGERLVAEKVVASAHAPRPRYWFNVPIGRSHIHISTTANTESNKISCRLYMKHAVAAAALAQLAEHESEIEAEIGQKLQWAPNDNAIDKTIVAEHDADLWAKSKWPEYLDWLVDMVVRFKNTFTPRVKELKL